MLTEEVKNIKLTGARNSEMASHPPKKPAAGGKKCIYMREENCVLPYTPFTLCKTCPYGYIYCFGAVVKNVYGKIVGLAGLFFRVNRRL